MRSIFAILLLIAVVQSQFDLASATTSTRRPSWIRSKVSRVREWVGWRRSSTTTTQHPILTTRRRFRDRIRERIGWTSTATQNPHESPERKLGVGGGAVAVGVGAGVGIGASRLIDTDQPQPDESWVDRMKKKFGMLHDMSTSAIEHTTEAPLDSTTSTTTTTPKKSLLDRAKAHLGLETTTVPPNLPSTTPKPGFFGRAFSKLKSMLNIGSTDPEKPNLVVKYGKKAVEKLGPKVLEKIKQNFRGMSSYFSTDEEFPTQLQNFEGRTQTDLLTLKDRVEKLEKLVEGLQGILLKEWNVTDSGSKYRLFEERKNWDTAERHCQGFGAHLAIIDNEITNSFVKNLINGSETSDFAWIGMKTKTTTQSSTFTNFDSESPIDGCAVMDSKGVWSIRSCIQLRPFVCQIVSSQS